jgi:hypothetical protein
MRGARRTLRLPITGEMQQTQTHPAIYAANDIIRAKIQTEMMRAMKLIRAAVVGIWGLSALASCAAQAGQAPGRWSTPATQLSAQIADILGPGQAQVILRNLSTIPASELPAIRKLLEQDLRARGVVPAGAESANTINVTLSENAHERVWVAEVTEGSETHVAIVNLDASATPQSIADARMVLRSEKIAGLVLRIGGIVHDDPILAAGEINGHFVAVFPDRISVFSSTGGIWRETNTFPTESKLDRDPRGLLIASADGGSFTAYLAGTECLGSYSLPLAGSIAESGWSVRCHASDDPWPIYQSGDAAGATPLKAFYNSARDYFTGVTTPGIGLDLPPFYTAGIIPRAAGGAALLISGIDGNIRLVENSVMRTVAGTRDWGSDFAVVRSGCGAGTQVIASSSGEAVSDSLRAFEIPALDALPVSASLALNGTVTALWTAQDGKSTLAVVRNTAGEFEVDRVTALCN